MPDGERASGHDGPPVRRGFWLAIGYLAGTVALWCVMTAAQSCFQWQNAHHLTDMQRRDLCIDIWSACVYGSMLLQLGWLALMASPLSARFFGSGARLAMSVLAALVLLTNPMILMVLFVAFGGARS